MELKKLNKSINITSACAIFLLMVFAYLYGGLKLFNSDVRNIVFAVLTLMLVLKTFIDMKDEKAYYHKVVSVMIEFVTLSIIFCFNKPAIWMCLLFAIPIITTTFNFGRKYALGVFILSGFILAINFNAFEEKILQLGYVYVILIFIWIAVGLIDKQKYIEMNHINQSITTNNELTAENMKIQQDIEEIKKINDGLESANQRLEDSNYKLNKQVAEFYTLQQISQAIATILDIKELLSLVNDVIVGVIGVNYSTILLINETGKLDIKVTNVSADQELDTLKSSIECDTLNKVFESGKAIIDNDVDVVKYPFIKDRDIKSIICIPLSSKNENYGIVLVEQKMADAFNNEHLKILSIIGNQTSVALENVGLYEKMQKMATTDGLTKIYNRLYFNEKISKEMAKADQGSYPVAISIFDIDHFKKFNDTYGHLFGDKVLKTIAKLGKDSIREQDTIARYGGEEFVILMPNTTLDEAFEIVENLRIKISECHVKEDSVSASVTASFGIGCYPMHGSIEAEVLSAADTALYKAKMDGRNCTRIYNETMREK